MMKSMILTTMMGALAAPAFADALPPPPTAVYEEPNAQTCEPVTIRVYFQNGEAMLSSHARSVIEETQARLSECAILDVNMVAVSADGRTLDEINDIGGERLAIVAAALRDEGLLPVSASARIETQTADPKGVWDRRVDVTLAAYDPNVG